MSLELNRLRCNFQEIFHSVTHSTGDRLCLVANFSGTRIYNSSRGWGRIWRYFYSVFDCVFQQNKRLEKLKLAVIGTHRLFFSNFRSVQENCRVYEKYLQSRGEGYHFDEELCHPIRQKILDWNRSTQPFVYLMRQLTHEKLIKLFELCFGKGRGFAEIWDRLEIKNAEVLGKIIDLEGLNGESLPLEVFKKIVRKKPLNEIDSKELQKWIGRINGIDCSIGLVHEAIGQIVDRYIFRSPLYYIQDSVAEFEAFLEDRGCKVFSQGDPEHLLWQKGLKKGMVIDLRGESYVLGSQIHSKKASRGNTKVYFCDNKNGDNQDFVVLSAQNKAALGIRKFRLQYSRIPGQGNYRIENASIDGIFDDGRLGVMEKLDPLNLEKECEGGKLPPYGTSLLTNLCLALQEWIKQDVTPLNFNYSSIMQDRSGRLKAMSPLQMGEFDFNALEDFMFSLSWGNEAIFTYLMKHTRLSDHPIAVFYSELLRNALSKDPTPVEDLAAVYKIADPRVVDRGKVFVKEAIALSDQRYVSEQQNFPDQEPQLIRQKVIEELLKAYKKSGAVSRLLPNLIQTKKKYAHQ